MNKLIDRVLGKTPPLPDRHEDEELLADLRLSWFKVRVRTDKLEADLRAANKQMKERAHE